METDRPPAMDPKQKNTFPSNCWFGLMADGLEGRGGLDVKGYLPHLICKDGVHTRKPPTHPNQLSRLTLEGEQKNDS